VLTGHTLDDQAETVLMRLLRGSGAEGLGGIEAQRALVEGDEVLLARPLVGWARRVQTVEYCRERHVEFRVDEMNVDERFARVRVRQELLPLMESFNPRVVEALARTAELPGGSFVERRRGRLLLKSRIQNLESRSQKKREIKSGSPP